MEYVFFLLFFDPSIFADARQVHRRVIKRVRWLLEDEKIVEDPITHKVRGGSLL